MRQPASQNSIHLKTVSMHLQQLDTRQPLGCLTIMSEKPGLPATDRTEPVKSDQPLQSALSDLDARLKAARTDQVEASRQPTATTDGSAMAQGMKLVSEFVAGIVTGGLLGWVIDKLTGFSPFGLLIGLMFGFAAGLRNLYRATQRGAQPPAPPEKGPTD